jgi:hypothetical protein
VTAVSVTAEHIFMGDREDCETCPVALAIAETFDDLTHVAVGPDVITLQDLEGSRVRIGASREVQEFIWDFDDGGTPGPFTFELDYPAVKR